MRLVFLANWNVNNVHFVDSKHLVISLIEGVLNLDEIRVRVRGLGREALGLNEIAFSVLNCVTNIERSICLAFRLGHVEHDNNVTLQVTNTAEFCGDGVGLAGLEKMSITLEKRNGMNIIPL
jgi:hypothetical protein